MNNACGKMFRTFSRPYPPHAAKYAPESVVEQMAAQGLIHLAAFQSVDTVTAAAATFSVQTKHHESCK
jgi:hypothetical protein